MNHFQEIRLDEALSSCLSAQRELFHGLLDTEVVVEGSRGDDRELFLRRVKLLRALFTNFHGSLLVLIEEFTDMRCAVREFQYDGSPEVKESTEVVKDNGGAHG
ncbi:hypothetical protein [Methylosinus sp. Sm6]|uniref:hypothetical protein n=1 Tax=Methylosinus sp. Sm6 TaxID=2866948 RepID=UPI001C997BC0|nr:hypothetical protein [Methylosinus sp. Sm6]MBY6243517.1 hypothetical protein [Methylosinus sp. Sm6]